MRSKYTLIFGLSLLWLPTCSENTPVTGCYETGSGLSCVELANMSSRHRDVNDDGKDDRLACADGDDNPANVSDNDKDGDSVPNRFDCDNRPECERYGRPDDDDDDDDDGDDDDGDDDDDNTTTFRSLYNDSHDDDDGHDDDDDDDGDDDDDDRQCHRKHKKCTPPPDTNDGGASDGNGTPTCPDGAVECGPGGSCPTGLVCVIDCCVAR